MGIVDSSLVLLIISFATAATAIPFLPNNNNNHHPVRIQKFIVSDTNIISAPFKTDSAAMKQQDEETTVDNNNSNDNNSNDNNQQQQQEPLLPATTQEKIWHPLESNPTSLNQYISKLGFNTNTSGNANGHENNGSEEGDDHGSDYESPSPLLHFVDVYSTESWALDMIPSPVYAVVALFPMTDKVVKKRREMHLEALRKSHNVGGDEVVGSNDNDNDVWYIKQRIRNACGTIAILHALANIPQSIQQTNIQPSSWLHTFLQKTTAKTTKPTTSQQQIIMTPTQKAILLENDPLIEQYHDEASNNDTVNSTPRGNITDVINRHFVTFVHVNGKLYELDGRVDITTIPGYVMGGLCKEGPIHHGATSQGELLRDACGILREWMEVDLEEVRFTILALASK